MKNSQFSVPALTGLGGAACMAAILTMSSGAAAQAGEVELSYGVDITTNYLSKGLTNSDNKAAIQPWAEVGMNGFYMAAWASNASFDDVKDVELDVGVGYRHSFGKLDMDIGYTQYFYRDDDADYGEAHVFGTYNFTEQFAGGVEYYREVYADQDWLYVHASYSGLPADLTLSGGIGTDFGSQGYEEDLMAYDLGLTKELNDYSAFDVRVTHSSIEDTSVGATISFYY